MNIMFKFEFNTGCYEPKQDKNRMQHYSYKTTPI
jgi:hypothetical protein